MADSGYRGPFWRMLGSAYGLGSALSTGLFAMRCMACAELSQSAAVASRVAANACLLPMTKGLVRMAWARLGCRVQAKGPCSTFCQPVIRAMSGVARCIGDHWLVSCALQGCWVLPYGASHLHPPPSPSRLL